MDKRLLDKTWRLSHLYKIRDKEGKLITFKPNRAQKHYSENHWYRNLILKSRQLGFTTFEAIDALDDVLFTPNMDALMIAHNLEAGESIFSKKIAFAWEKLPDEIRALYAVDGKTSKTLKFGFGKKGFSSIAVDTSGRSGTYQRTHITELADIAKKYPKKIPDIIEGTIPAIPSSGRLDIESTSQGASGEFYDMFMSAYERGEPTQNQEYKAHFYNWTWDDEEMAKITPMYFDQMEQGEKFEAYAQRHKLTPVQITYYYQKWLSLNKKWNALKREYPTTPEEAFEAIAEGTFYGEQIGLMEQNGQIGLYPYDRALKVHTVWDLGVGLNMRVGFFQRDTTINRTFMIDHLCGEGSEGLPELIAKVKRRPYIFGKHFGPHDLETTDVGTGKTRIESARALDFTFTMVPDVSIEDGINAVPLFLDRLSVNKATCDHSISNRSWVKSMKNYGREWDEKRGMYKDEALHNWASHDADMTRYAALVENKMTNETFRVPTNFHDKTLDIWRG
jgi:hypothetical protein